MSGKAGFDWEVPEGLLFRLVRWLGEVIPHSAINLEFRRNSKFMAECGITKKTV